MRLRNARMADHDWVLQGEDGAEIVRVVLAPGERGEARFNLEPGDYHVSCTMEGHWELGMRGTLRAR